MSKNMTYEELVANVNKFNVDLSLILIVPGSTCRTFIKNDDDVQFMLEEERVIPQVCVSLTKRTVGDVIGNDIPPSENTQQFGSFSCSNKLFTQGGENICGVLPVAVDHADVVEPQLAMCLGSSIRGFRRCMRHVIAVDGTHLKGRFDGTMFMATA